MSVTTVSKFESTMSDLDAMGQTLIDAQLFDEAETIETALLFMKLLRNTDLLTADPTQETLESTHENLRNLCVRMKELQNQALDLKAQAADVRLPLDDLRKRQIPEMMAELEVTTVTFAGLGRVQLAPDLYASTRKGQKLNAMQWLRDCGYEGLIQESYNASSIKAIFRKMIIDGAEIPDGIFAVTPYIRASIVKA